MLTNRKKLIEVALLLEAINTASSAEKLFDDGIASWCSIVLSSSYERHSIRKGKTMEAVTTISAKYQIVIPRAVREQFQLKPGQKVMFIPYQKSIRLVIVPPIEDALGMFRGIKSDQLREEEDEAR